MFGFTEPKSHVSSIIFQRAMFGSFRANECIVYQKSDLVRKGVFEKNLTEKNNRSKRSDNPSDFGIFGDNEVGAGREKPLARVGERHGDHRHTRGFAGLDAG